MRRWSFVKYFNFITCLATPYVSLTRNCNQQDRFLFYKFHQWTLKGFLLQKRLAGEWWETIQKFTKILIRVGLALVHEDQSLSKCFDIQMLCNCRHLKKTQALLTHHSTTISFSVVFVYFVQHFATSRTCPWIASRIFARPHSLGAINTAEGQIKVIVIIKPLFHATFILFVVSKMRDDALYFFIDSNRNTL